MHRFLTELMHGKHVMVLRNYVMVNDDLAHNNKSMYALKELIIEHRKNNIVMYQ